MNPGQHAVSNYISAAVDFLSLNEPETQEIPLTPRVKAHGKVDQCNFSTNNVNSFHGNIPFLLLLKTPEKRIQRL